MRTSACLVQYLAVNGVFNRDGDCSLRDRARLKRDGTRVETRFRLSAKRTSPFKSAGTSVQSTAGSRGVRISVSNAGYTTFRGSVSVLATHSIRQFPLHFPSRAHRVPSGFKRALWPDDLNIIRISRSPDDVYDRLWICCQDTHRAWYVSCKA